MITNLATKATLNVKINEVKEKIARINKLPTNTPKKKPDVSNLVRKNSL